MPVSQGFDQTGLTRTLSLWNLTVNAMAPSSGYGGHLSSGKAMISSAGEAAPLKLRRRFAIREHDLRKSLEGKGI